METLWNMYSVPKSFLLLVDYSFVIFSVRKLIHIMANLSKKYFVLDYAQ